MNHERARGGSRHPSILSITPTLNAAAALPDGIALVATQVHVADQVVINGGSTDGTVEPFDLHHSRLARTLFASGRSLYDSINKGVSLSCSTGVEALNADDCIVDGGVLEDVVANYSEPIINAVYRDND